MSVGDPIDAMANRLVLTAARHGVDPRGRARVETAFRTAVEQRRDYSQRDPELLHPARTVLILLDDAQVNDDEVLSAAALVESENDRLAVANDRVKTLFGARVAERVQAVPRPAACGEELLEALLVADPDTQRIALAERLDHARHLHRRPRAVWANQHEIISQAYLPVAERVDVVLGRRLRWWCTMFERRYLTG